MAHTHALNLPDPLPKYPFFVPAMAWIDRPLDLFDRHKYGIIGTLMVHTLLLFVLFVYHVEPRSQGEGQMPIELELEAAAPEPAPQEQQADGSQGAAAQVTNQASNSTAATSADKPLSRAAQERMSESVERDLHNLEQAEFGRLAEERKAQGKEITVPELDPSKFDKRNYMEKPPKPVKVEGLTTVSYDLKGRAHLVLDVPAYLCKGSGKIVVQVAVDRSGVVAKAELDPAASSTVTGCMAENALQSAANARFTSAANAAQPQRGTITYIFLAQ